jgi:hypothetical protein
MGPSGPYFGQYAMQSLQLPPIPIYEKYYYKVCMFTERQNNLHKKKEFLIDNFCVCITPMKNLGCILEHMLTFSTT